MPLTSQKLLLAQVVEDRMDYQRRNLQGAAQRLQICGGVERYTPQHDIHYQIGRDSQPLQIPRHGSYEKRILPAK